MCSSVTVGTGKKVLKTFYKVGYFREIGVFLSLLLRHDTCRSLDDNYKVGAITIKLRLPPPLIFFPSNDFHVFIFGKLRTGWPRPFFPERNAYISFNFEVLQKCLNMGRFENYAFYLSK